MNLACGRIYSFIQDIRRKNPNTLVFDGGDTRHRTLPLINLKGEAIIPILNKIGFQAMVDHWGFDYGSLYRSRFKLKYPPIWCRLHPAQ